MGIHDYIWLYLENEEEIEVEEVRKASPGAFATPLIF
jgi:hypothetical protein